MFRMFLWCMCVCFQQLIERFTFDWIYARTRIFIGHHTFPINASEYVMTMWTEYKNILCLSVIVARLSVNYAGSVACIIKRKSVDRLKHRKNEKHVYSTLSSTSREARVSFYMAKKFYFIALSISFAFPLPLSFANLSAMRFSEIVFRTVSAFWCNSIPRW